MSCHVVTLETDPCVCHSIFTHPCQRPESLPLCKVSISTFPPPTSVTLTCQSRQSLARKRPNQTKPSATPPFQPASMSVSSKSGSKTPKTNKPRPDPTFDPSRIRFLILIEFSLTTPNRGMVLPVRAATQAGGLNYC